mmetsp:Transcript_17326/g.66026  ORF Transcript_17326/g.66026 Transcript_17326/m.66026 type:complete len:207 (-) Transcript_17326:165-785(-)
MCLVGKLGTEGIALQAGSSEVWAAVLLVRIGAGGPLDRLGHRHGVVPKVERHRVDDHRPHLIVASLDETRQGLDGCRLLEGVVAADHVDFSQDIFHLKRVQSPLFLLRSALSRDVPHVEVEGFRHLRHPLGHEVPLGVQHDGLSFDAAEERRNRAIHRDLHRHLRLPGTRNATELCDGRRRQTAAQETIEFADETDHRLSAPLCHM